MKFKIFTYGTLLRNCGNDHLLVGSKLLEANAITPPTLTMLNLGSFPGIVEDGTTAVKGELYEVDEDTLARLDRLEGHPGFYERKPIAITTAEGEVAAEAYFLPKSYLQRCKVIESGSWREGS